MVSLSEELVIARKKVVTDGYEMSIGEVINLYKDGELVIDPVFQRLYRWDEERKTRFVESLLLGIPIPPIFVFQREDGVWELIDGLQRLSTVLQLTGDLKGERADQLGPLILNGTKFLPSLNGMRWEPSGADAADGLGKTLQIEIKRARLRVEILKSESDQTAKFELFQRLNTGGAVLTEQEVRNSIAVSLNNKFHELLVSLSHDPNFKVTTDQTERALDAQAGMELTLRFLAFKNVPYTPGLDVNEYLDDALVRMATDPDFDYEENTDTFRKTFAILNAALGSKAFKRWNGRDFSGKFLISVFEVIATGTLHNLDAFLALSVEEQAARLKTSAINLWDNEIFKSSSGAGVRGTTRLTKLLPIAADVLRV